MLHIAKVSVFISYNTIACSIASFNYERCLCSQTSKTFRIKERQRVNTVRKVRIMWIYPVFINIFGGGGFWDQSKQQKTNCQCLSALGITSTDLFPSRTSFYLMSGQQPKIKLCKCNIDLKMYLVHSYRHTCCGQKQNNAYAYQVCIRNMATTLILLECCNASALAVCIWVLWS